MTLDRLKGLGLGTSILGFGSIDCSIQEQR